MSEEKAVRNSNVELLRIILMFGIILMHTITANVDETIYIGINVLGNIGVTCFVLISGYFGIRLKIKKILQLDIRFIFYSLLTLCVMVWGGKEAIGLRTLMSNIMPIISNKSWFISCYIILSILSPFLNEFVSIISRAKLKELIIINSVIFLAIPTIFGFDLMGMAGKDLIHIILTYFIGRYIGLYGEEQIKRIKYPGGLLGAVCILNFLLTYSYYKIKGTIIIDYYRDNSIFTMAEAIMLFCLSKKHTFFSKTINHLAENVLSVYMLERLCDFVILYFWDYALYMGGNWWPLIAVFVVLMKMVMAFLINEIYRLLLGRLEKRGIDYLAEKMESGLRFLKIKLIEDN